MIPSAPASDGAGFERVVHCDWSARPAGRWMAEAHRDGPGWIASGPCRVGDAASFLARLVDLSRAGPALAAFDFPIGLPEAFCDAAGLDSFSAALESFGQGAWSQFYDVAAEPGEISRHRPFYPARPGGTGRNHLLDRHGVTSIDDLMRACERASPQGRSAGCMFWTLGAQQVGKAALHGWRTVVAPARRQDARLWPFDGDLATLARRGGLTIAESYPADALLQLGLKVLGKRYQPRRAELAGDLIDWAKRRDVALAGPLEAAIRAGFPAAVGADDGFDAVIGLWAALAVVRGERPEGAPDIDAVRRLEGWILGKRGAV